MIADKDLLKKNEQLTAEIAILRKSNAELEQQQNVLQEAYKLLKENETAWRNDREAQQALLDKRQGRINVLEQQLRTARTENVMLRKSRNDVDDTAETTAVEELKSALDEMRAQWNIAIRAATAYQQDIEQLNLVIADLETEHHLREALDECATRDNPSEDAPLMKRVRIEGDEHIVVDIMENSVRLSFEVLRADVLDEAKFQALRAKLQGALASVATENQAEGAGDGD